MAIDFLGKEQPKKTAKTREKIIFHQPDKVKKTVSAPPPKPVKVKKTPPVVIEEELGEVNLITGFKAYLLKRRIVIILIAFVIIVVLGLGLLYLITRPAPIVINTNINQPLPPPVCGNGRLETGEQCDQSACGIDQECVNCQCQDLVLPPPVCGNGRLETGEQCDQSACLENQICNSLCQCQEIVPPQPVCGNGVLENGEQCDLAGCPDGQECDKNCQCQIVILSDTELAPLRGTLVRFVSSNEIFLIEWNGELRLVDQVSAVFKNGETIQELGSRIYTINESFMNVRLGKDVKGFIDWDPRILTEVELQNFK